MIGEPLWVENIIDDSKSEKENIQIINDFIKNKIVELGNELEKSKKKKEKNT